MYDSKCEKKQREDHLNVAVKSERNIHLESYLMARNKTNPKIWKLKVVFENMEKD